MRTTSRWVFPRRVTVEVMTASTPHEERQLTIRRFEQGITKIIINVGVLVAGFDSDVRCIIFARPTKVKFAGFRRSGVDYVRLGKDHCLIFDHSGTVNKLGYPDDIEYDYLPSSSDGMEEAPQRVTKTDRRRNCRKVQPVPLRETCRNLYLSEMWF